MAVVTRTTTWVDGNTLTASALNGEFNNLLNALALTNADVASNAAINESKILFSNTGHGHTGGSDGKLIAVGGANAIVMNNNIAVQGKDSGAVARNMIYVDTSNNLQVGDTSNTGHVILNPGANKFTKVTALRQDISANTYKNNSIILTGWGYIQGNNSISITGAIAFGITFAAIPIILVSPLGEKIGGGVPTALSDFATFVGYDIAEAVNPSTTGFTIGIAIAEDGTGGQHQLLNTNYYGFTWIAIGEL